MNDTRGLVLGLKTAGISILSVTSTHIFWNIHLRILYQCNLISPIVTLNYVHTDFYMQAQWIFPKL